LPSQEDKRLQQQSDKDMVEQFKVAQTTERSAFSDLEHSFIQVARNIDDDNAKAGEVARLEAQSDKDMGEDDDENTQSDQSSESSGDEESFIQLKRNIDDDNAEAAEMARLEAQSDKDMGEDDDKNTQPGQSSESSDDEESFIQLKRNVDDDNAEAAEMARLEAQSDKDMGEDDDENTQSDQSTEGTADEESFIQLKRNIDDDNAEAAEMARLEAQSDKDMGEDDDENTQSDQSNEGTGDAESFIQLKRNIDDDNAEAAEMARLGGSLTKTWVRMMMKTLSLIRAPKAPAMRSLSSR
jgi:hypothetical protein